MLTTDIWLTDRSPLTLLSHPRQPLRTMLSVVTVDPGPSLISVMDSKGKLFDASMVCELPSANVNPLRLETSQKKQA